MTKKNVVCLCNGMSDKDFIFEIFSDKGFVTDANRFLKSDKAHKSDAKIAGMEGEHQADADDCSFCR